MTFYLSGAGVYGLFLLFSKISDRECSKTDLRSWLVLIVASTFWIVVLPLSSIELIAKAKSKRDRQLDEGEMREENTLQIKTIPVQETAF
ncbi:MAG: hypothetical protein AAFQ41_03980 [Cyanobacteria bacterium J06623_7]